MLEVYRLFLLVGLWLGRPKAAGTVHSCLILSAFIHDLLRNLLGDDELLMN